MKTLLLGLLLDPVTLGVLLVIAVVGGLMFLQSRGERAKALALFALQAFLEAEKIIPDNSGPVWLQKTDKALKAFSRMYRDAFGYDIPTDAVAAAKRLWTIWSAEQKGLVTAVK